MNSEPFLAQTIAELVRRDSRVVLALADVGIGPRYLHWSVEASARDLGINLDRVAARLRLVFPGERLNLAG
jgi:hypothetical protein